MIVIEESDAAADGFENMVLRVDGSINAGRGEAGLACDVGELGIERQTGAFPALLRADVARRHALRAGATQERFAEGLGE